MSMSAAAPLARISYEPERVDQLLAFLKSIRGQLREFRRVRVWPDRFQVFDVNGDFCEIAGLGYPQDQVVTALNAVNAVYKPETIHDATEAPYKEFQTGRRYPWAADRCM